MIAYFCNNLFNNHNCEKFHLNHRNNEWWLEIPLIYKHFHNRICFKWQTISYWRIFRVCLSKHIILEVIEIAWIFRISLRDANHYLSGNNIKDEEILEKSGGVKNLDVEKFKNRRWKDKTLFHYFLYDLTLTRPLRGKFRISADWSLIR